MTTARPVISHIVISCFDLARMRSFYTDVLGFFVSDSGRAGENELCFLTFDPETEHHQIALTGGRKGRPGDGALVHVCFRLASYARLQARHRGFAARGLDGLVTMTHGSWMSLYVPDPEGNKIEFRWDTPWYVGQPFAQPVDLSRGEEEIRQATLEQNRDNPRFQPMEAWRAKALAKMAEKRESE